MAAVAPCVTDAGAVTPLTAMSVTGGASTSIPIPTLLFAGLASASFWVAKSVWPAIAAPAVFQSRVRVTLTPTASPVMVWVATVAPANPSVSTTSKLVVTSSPPTFCTVTTTCAVSPWATERGPVMPVTARSVPGGAGGGGGGGGDTDGSVTLIPIPMLLFAGLASASCCVANSVCPVIAAPAVFQGISTVVVAPTTSPATVPVPTVGPAHPSVRITVKLGPTSTSPTFCTVTMTCAVSPCATERGPVMPVRAISVGLGVTVTTDVSLLFAALSSDRLCVATSVCPPSAAPVVFQLKTTNVLVPGANPATVCVPSVTPAVESCRLTVKLLVTF